MGGSPTIAKGFASRAGWRKNPNTWGCGLPVAVGAGHGVEFDADGLSPDVTLILNDAMTGTPFRAPGIKGNELHAGPFGPCPLYFQGLERLIAQVFGTAGTPTQQGGTLAYKHVFKCANSTAALAGTLVIDGQVRVREYPFVKLGGLSIEVAQNQMVKVTFRAVPFGVNYNIGTLDDAAAVAVTDMADVTYTLVGQPTAPTPLIVTMVDANASVTEHVVTITGTDRDDNFLQVVVRKTVSLIQTTAEYFKTVTSIVGSGTTGVVGAGVDTIKVGYTYGVNSVAQAALITTPSAGREFVTFKQMKVFINEQGGADFVAGSCTANGDEFYPNRFMLDIERNLAADDVTTAFGNKPDNPTEDDFVVVSGALDFSKWMSTNHRIVEDRLAARRLKMKIEFTGPIAATPFPYKLTLYFNNVQFDGGNGPNVEGAGRQPLAYTFQASRATALPTGFPSGYTDAIVMELTNLNTVDALTDT